MGRSKKRRACKRLEAAPEPEDEQLIDDTISKHLTKVPHVRNSSCSDLFPSIRPISMEKLGEMRNEVIDTLQHIYTEFI